MCGIYGSLGDVGPDPSEAVARMGGLLSHRGPHSSRVVETGTSQLGCARLRIVDLSHGADGPLTSRCGQLTLTCNGEIYNSPQLRSRYKGYPFKTSSDLEVIFPLFLDRGIAGLSDLVGMFALALRDARTDRFLLMRDPSGEKPLFYCKSQSGIVFASEMQSLLSWPTTSRALDRESLLDYLQLGYVRSPKTMFKDIRQLRAGTIAVAKNGSIEERSYWPEETIRTDLGGTASRPDELLRRLRSSVRQQAAADVSRGIYLSGGLDSSLLAALFREFLAPEELTAFTLEFENGSYDESNWAREVARSLDLKVETVRLGEDELAKLWQRVLTEIADPISDPALLPTVALGQRASESVRVVFSGEGADELFGGYPTYLGHRLAERYNQLPSMVRGGIRRASSLIGTSHEKMTLSYLAKRFLQDAEQPWIERHVRWFGPGSDKLALLGRPPAAAVSDLRSQLENLDELDAAMKLDYSTYLRDNLLVKLDRGTMLSSVESRAPFLDPEVIRFAWSMSGREKVRGLTTKVLLKRAASSLLPSKIVHRRKRGLSLPIAAWLNAGLRTEVDRLLEPGRLDRQGLFDAKAVSACLADHRSLQADHSRMLWNVVHLQGWLDQWAPGQELG